MFVNLLLLVYDMYGSNTTRRGGSGTCPLIHHALLSPVVSILGLCPPTSALLPSSRYRRSFGYELFDKYARETATITFIGGTEEQLVEASREVDKIVQDIEVNGQTYQDMCSRATSAVTGTLECDSPPYFHFIDMVNMNEARGDGAALTVAKATLGVVKDSFFNHDRKILSTSYRYWKDGAANPAWREEWVIQFIEKTKDWRKGEVVTAVMYVHSAIRPLVIRPTTTTVGPLNHQRKGVDATADDKLC